MNRIGRHFRLSEQWDQGVFCSQDGVFLGGIPVLERDSAAEWRPRTVSSLNHDLSKRYGLPMEFGLKLSGLRTIAKALGRGTSFMHGSRPCICKFLIRLC
jgi:hypothetical protein